MAIVGAIDVHRGQLTYDYVETETGEVWRGKIRPADRDHLRAWLTRFAEVEAVAFAVEACTGWRYVVEELQRVGCEVHLAEPAEASGRGPKQRPKTDAADARHLRQLLLEVAGEGGTGELGEVSAAASTGVSLTTATIVTVALGGRLLAEQACRHRPPNLPAPHNYADSLETARRIHKPTPITTSATTA